ncbi:MAG: cell division protein FtsA [Prevotellaceae bacterium]|jgi:cell division protein FtsA|nr:cell division protein FtsA [Prevotellaceae bacterium]
MSKYVVAIDLGTTKIVSIVGEKTENGRYNILDYSEVPSYGIRRGEVENIGKVTNAVIPTLEKIKAKMQIEIKNVYVGIAGQHITCVENRIERIRHRYDELITKEEIITLEEDAGKLHLNPETEILHIIPRHYSVDEKNDIIDPVGRLGNKLAGHFYVITGHKSTRIHTSICMERLNLSLQKLILEPIASARTTLNEEEKEAGVIMIDIGGGTTDLIIYKDQKIIHTAVIPFGGNIITDDIKEGCGILQAQAEQAKIKFGLSAKDNNDDLLEIEGINGRPPRNIPLKTISSIISSRLNEIVDMVMAEIEKAKCTGLNLGIVVTGGVSKMKGIKDFLQKKTGMVVKIGTPDHIINDPADNIFHPKYATAVGLIMCGFDHLENSPPPLPPPPPPLLTPPFTPPPLPVTSWWSRAWDAVITFMGPQKEERND